MSDLVFYTNPQSRGQIVHWMLEETGADYETVTLEYGPAMKEPAYLAINPMGKVPAIKHGRQIVTECAAICAYLADAFPGAGLAPPLPDRGDYYRWLFFAAGPLEQATTNHQFGWEVRDDQTRMAGYGNFRQVVDVLEQALSGRQYIAADHFTAADVYVGAHVGWGMAFGSLPKRPVFETYFARLAERPACPLTMS